MVEGGETGMGKSHGLVEMVVDILVERFTADATHQVAHKHESQVAVAVAFFGVEGALCDKQENGVEAGSLLPIAVESLEACTMTEGLLEGDVGFIGLFQIGQVFAELVIEFDFPFVNQFHDSKGGGGDFGEGGEIVEGLLGHFGRLGIIGEVSVSAVKDFSAFVEDDNLTTGDGLGLLMARLRSATMS